MTDTERLNNLFNLYEDFKGIKAHVVEADKSCRDMTEAIQQRIKDERLRNEERIGYLKSVIGDADKSSTSKHIAQIELEQLSSAAYQVTEAEDKAFSEQVEDFRNTVSEAYRVRNEIREAIKQISDQLQDIKTECSEGWVGQWNDMVSSRTKEYEGFKNGVK